MLDFLHETQPTYSYIRICQVTVSEAAIFICGMQPRRRNPRKKITIPKNNGPEQDNTFFCVRAFLFNLLGPILCCCAPVKAPKRKEKPSFSPFPQKQKEKGVYDDPSSLLQNFLTVEFQARSLNPSYRPGSLA